MSTEYEWNDQDRARLRDLEAANEGLPSDAPRALLSVRLSVFTDDTTSPVRQELDLRRAALDKGMRVVGIASDLGTSATKVPPWKRKELGAWLNDRAPEFDVIMFWKLDRFIRRLSDLAVMIRWAETYSKNLVSLNDPIDLSTTMGKIMVTFIGGVAEIEAANTKTRVESTWAYAKTQSEWIVGKPPFGYAVEKAKDGNRLVIDPEQARFLHRARELVLAGESTAATIRTLQGEGLANQKLTVATLTRRLRNPGILGYRTEEQKGSGYRRSAIVRHANGDPVVVGDPIFTTDEWETLQAALDKRAKKQPARNPSGATRFLGVLVCADCGSNLTVQQFTKRPGPGNGNRLKSTRSYAYLRCQECKSGGLGAPNPQEVYDRLVADVLGVIGDFPVQAREYAQGEENRQRAKELQERIAYYMKGLEPGGRLTKARFAQEQAEHSLDQAIAELDSIDPTSMEDRWVYVDQGKTFRQHWEEGGMEAMGEDLLRAGITCVVTRTKVAGQRAPEVDLKLRIPKDVRDRLVVRGDDFGSPL